MSTLTAQDIRLMLADLECAEKYRHLPGMHADCIASVREILLCAAIGDVEVEPVREEYPDHGPTDPWETSGPGRRAAA